MKTNILFSLFILISSQLNTSCSKTEAMQKIITVSELNPEKYSGTWYEIARKPFPQEEGMTHVTATYTLLESGKIGVLNKGLKAGKWKEAKGKAYIPDNKFPGSLRVSFFWPFHGDYQVIALDENYQWSLVVAGGGKWAWFLSRKSNIDPETFENMKTIAINNGIDISNLIVVDHNNDV